MQAHHAVLTKHRRTHPVNKQYVTSALVPVGDKATSGGSRCLPGRHFQQHRVGICRGGHEEAQRCSRQGRPNRGAKRGLASPVQRLPQRQEVACSLQVSLRCLFRILTTTAAPSMPSCEHANNDKTHSTRTLGLEAWIGYHTPPLEGRLLRRLCPSHTRLPELSLPHRSHHRPDHPHLLHHCWRRLQHQTAKGKMPLD